MGVLCLVRTARRRAASVAEAILTALDDDPFADLDDDDLEPAAVLQPATVGAAPAA